MQADHVLHQKVLELFTELCFHGYREKMDVALWKIIFPTQTAVAALKATIDATWSWSRILCDWIRVASILMWAWISRHLLSMCTLSGSLCAAIIWMWSGTTRCSLTVCTCNWWSCPIILTTQRKGYILRQPIYVQQKSWCFNISLNILWCNLRFCLFIFRRELPLSAIWLLRRWMLFHTARVTNNINQQKA